jgi:hypothetical protein
VREEEKKMKTKVATAPRTFSAPPPLEKHPEAEKWHRISPATISSSGHVIAQMPAGEKMVGRIGACGTVFHEPLKR